MAQVNDDIFASVGEVQINDGQLAAYGTLNQYNDAKLAFTGEAGAMQDAWFAYLTGLGYSGALSDMWAEYWAAGGAGGGLSAQWDASYIHSAHSLTDNDQRVVGGNNISSCVAQGSAVISSPIYFEGYPTNRASGNFNNGLGMTLDSAKDTIKADTSYVLGEDINSFSWNAAGNFRYNGADTAVYGWFAPATFMIAFDTVTGNCYFGRDGTWRPGQDPTVPTTNCVAANLAGKDVRIAFSSILSLNDMLIRKGSENLYSAPSGFGILGG